MLVSMVLKMLYTYSGIPYYCTLYLEPLKVDLKDVYCKVLQFKVYPTTICKILNCLFKFLAQCQTWKQQQQLQTPGGHCRLIKTTQKPIFRDLYRPALFIKWSWRAQMIIVLYILAAGCYSTSLQCPTFDRINTKFLSIRCLQYILN